MITSQMNRFIRHYYAGIGTPFAKKCLALYDEGDWDNLVLQQVSPDVYTDYWAYALDSSAAALLRKCKDLETSYDLVAAAKRNWNKGESDCLRTNIRLEPYLVGMSHPDCNEAIYRHIVGIRKVIKSVLRTAPSRGVYEGKFGPGATFTDPSVRSTIADKMNNRASVTRGALGLLPWWFETFWGRTSANAVPPRDPIEVRGNRFATAPKDAVKDRPIAAEPSVNIYYQLALGKLVRRRLKNAGIDLDNGKEIHMQVACEASITGALCTLDLSNASDTVAYSLVKLLLPPDWFVLFNELRSTHTHGVDTDKCRVGEADPSRGWRKLEKFSSMGNGFTFELETLIYFGIVKYVEMLFINDDSGKTLVFGDDIITNTELAKPVISILTFLGFTLNMTKSFWDGPFRESCGGDYFQGRPVRPYFMEEFPCEPQDFVAAANSMRRVAEEAFGGLDLHIRAWFALLDQIPSGIRRLRGPKGLGDAVIFDSDSSKWILRKRSQTLYIRVLRPHRTQKVPWRPFDEEVKFACALYAGLLDPEGLTPRNPMISYKVGWMPLYGTRWTPRSLIRN